MATRALCTCALLVSTAVYVANGSSSSDTDSTSDSYSDSSEVTAAVTTTAAALGVAYSCLLDGAFYEGTDTTLFEVAEFVCDVEYCCSSDEAETSITLDCAAGEEHCHIVCSATRACAYEPTSITLNNAEYVECSGIFACIRTEFILEATAAAPFRIECTQSYACFAANFYVSLVPNMVTAGSQIVCTENSSCIQTAFHFENNTGETVTIELLDCEAAGSCHELVLEVLSGDVVITECRCGDSGCDADVVGFEICQTCTGASCP